MGKVVIKDASITINAVNLSNHVSKVTVATQFNKVDVSSMGDTFMEYLQGLGDATITVDFFQDFDSGEVDDTLWPLMISGSVFPIVVKPTSAAVSATNPSYTMSAILLTYDPIDASIGAASTTSVQFQNAGTAGVVKATA